MKNIQFVSQARQFIIDEAAASSSPASTLLGEVHQLISALQSVDKTDRRNVELRAGLLDESIDSAIEKLKLLKAEV